MIKVLHSSFLMLAGCLLAFAAHAQEITPVSTPVTPKLPEVVKPDDAQSDDAPWLVVGGISRHTCRDCGFRESNPGLAIQWSPLWLKNYTESKDWRLTAGAYINSNDKNSVYAGVQWLPLEYGFAKFGLQAVVISGYLKQAVTPTLLPTISIETQHIGADIFLVPKFPSVSAAVLVSFKVRY